MICPADPERQQLQKGTFERGEIRRLQVVAFVQDSRGGAKKTDKPLDSSSYILPLHRSMMVR